MAYEKDGNITDSDLQGWIKAAKAGKQTQGQRKFYDGHREAPMGFGVRVLKSGTVSFFLRYQNGGKDEALTIGKYPKPWSLTAARKRAGELRREIDGGGNPSQKRKLDRTAPTVAANVEVFCQKHFDKQKSGKASRSRLQRFFVEALGKEKLQDVRRPDIKRILEDVAEEHGRQAALLLTNLKSFYAWCEDEELVESNPVSTLRPEKVHPAMKSRPRTRVLDEEEIRSFWEQVETIGMHRLTAIALKLVLVLGQRPGEVAGMRWSEIQNQTWTIPSTRRGKTDTEHQVPLTKTAVELLAAAKAEVERLSERRKKKPDGDIVFETRPGKALRADAVSGAVGKYNADLGSKEHPVWGLWTAHDLRRTMRTALSAERVPVMDAEMAIGHTKKGIIGTYDAHQYQSEILAAMRKWEARLHRILAGLPGDLGESDDNVVPFTREGRA